MIWPEGSPVLRAVLAEHGVHVHPVHLQVLRLVQEGQFRLEFNKSNKKKNQFETCVRLLCCSLQGLLTWAGVCPLLFLYASSTSSSNSSFWFCTKRNSEMRAGPCCPGSKSPSSAATAAVRVPGCRGAGVPGCWGAGGTWRFHGRLGLPGLGVGHSSPPPGLDCWESAHAVRLFALPKVQVGLWPCYLVMPTIPSFGHRVLRQYLPCNKADS